MRSASASTHDHINPKREVMDDVQLGIDWDISRLVAWRWEPCELANDLHHGQMRNDVVLDAVSDRESPIFRNNKIVPVNGISGTVTFPLWRNDVSFSTLLILTV